MVPKSPLLRGQGAEGVKAVDCPPIMSIPIAIQLYSVRDDCAQDLMGTLAKVAEMGYEGVEFAGYHGHTAEAIKAKLDELGLACEGAHVGISQFDDENFEETVAFHKTIGCKWLVSPWIPSEMRESEASTLETCKMLTSLVEKLAAHGLQTGFHAHDGDMKPLDGGKSAWTIFGENTPKEFLMQYDTANGMAGGADPVEPIRQFPGRGQSVHLKEYSGVHGAKVIGEGDVPWAEVFEACESGAGTEWYVVEHESYEGMTPIESIDICLKNLRKMGK
jgi:sugar phosphate isomerase/epimerase